MISLLCWCQVWKGKMFFLYCHTCWSHGTFLCPMYCVLPFWHEFLLLNLWWKVMVNTLILKKKTWHKNSQNICYLFQAYSYSNSSQVVLMVINSYKEFPHTCSLMELRLLVFVAFFANFFHILFIAVSCLLADLWLFLSELSVDSVSALLYVNDWI